MASQVFVDGSGNLVDDNGNLIGRMSSVAIVGLVDDTEGVADDTLVDVGASFDQDVLNANFASLNTKLNEVLAALTGITG